MYVRIGCAPPAWLKSAAPTYWAQTSRHGQGMQYNDRATNRIPRLRAAPEPLPRSRMIRTRASRSANSSSSPFAAASRTTIISQLSYDWPMTLLIARAAICSSFNTGTITLMRGRFGSSTLQWALLAANLSGVLPNDRIMLHRSSAAMANSYNRRSRSAVAAANWRSRPAVVAASSCNSLSRSSIVVAMTAARSAFACLSWRSRVCRCCRGGKDNATRRKYFLKTTPHNP